MTWQRAGRALARTSAQALVSLALLEGVLWIACPLPSSLQRPVRQRLTQAVPGLKSEILYAEDAFGFRSMSLRAARKPPRTIRIICVGASTTQQATQSTPDTWSALLEQRLQEAFRERGVRVEVAARGGGGLTVLDGVRQCDDLLPIFTPDIVVTLWGVNDLVWHGGPDYRYPDPHRYDGNKPGWKRVLRRWSQIFGGLCNWRSWPSCASNCAAARASSGIPST